MEEKDTGNVLREQKAVGEEKDTPDRRKENEPEQEAPAPLTAHGKEWLLSAGVLLAAYLYLSFLFGSTALAHWLASWMNSCDRDNLLLVLFTVVFLAVGLIYARAGKKKAEKSSRGYLAMTIAAALWFPLFSHGNQKIYFLMFLFLSVMGVYWLLCMTGNRQGTYLDERGIADVYRGLVVLPFGGYRQIFREWGNLAVWALQSRKRMGSRGRQVVLGLLLSLPVLSILIPVLMAADHYFQHFVEKTLSGMGMFFGHWGVFSGLMTLIQVLMIGCYLYGLFYNAVNKKESCQKKRWQAPQALMGGVLVPVLALYLLFFLVRLFGVANAMDQIARGDLWISTYAREGFFELCWVAAINLALFGGIRWYSPEAGKTLRSLLFGLGAETLAFIGLAFSKMWYYIQSYHSFTFKRVMCCWLLLTLFVLFGLMMAELWMRRLKGVRIGVLFGCVTFLMLAYSNLPVWAA